MKTQFVLKSSKLSPPFVASTRKADMTKPVKNLIPLMFMAGGASYLGGMYFLNLGSEGLSSLGGSILVIMFLAAIALSMFAGGKK